MRTNPIGTIFRTFSVDEPHLLKLRQAGLECIQLAGAVERYLDDPQLSDHLFTLLDQHHLAVPSLFLSFERQTWATGDVGLTPKPSRVERMLLAARQMLWAARRNITLITCHVGDFPTPGSDDYRDWTRDMRHLCAFANDNGQHFLFETGPEPADTLLNAFSDIGANNLGINFDPANLLYYNCDDPAQFLAKTHSLIRVVHCKDAVRPQPGEPHGHETPLGQGDTHFQTLLKTLLAHGYHGPLIIERELPPGPEQELDVAQAVTLIRSILHETP